MPNTTDNTYAEPQDKLTYAHAYASVREEGQRESTMGLKRPLPPLPRDALEAQTIALQKKAEEHINTDPAHRASPTSSSGSSISPSPSVSPSSSVYSSMADLRLYDEIMPGLSSSPSSGYNLEQQHENPAHATVSKESDVTASTSKHPLKIIAPPLSSASEPNGLVAQAAKQLEKNLKGHSNTLLPASIPRPPSTVQDRA